MVETRCRSASVKCCSNVSTVRATRSRPVPRSLDEIVGRGKRNEEASVVAQDAPEFARTHPRRDRQDDRKRAIGVRHETIRIGHDPFASGEAPCRGIHGGNRDVHAMRIKTGLASERAEVETVSTAGIENDVAGRCGQDSRDGVQQRAQSRRDHAVAASLRRQPPCRPAAWIAAAVAGAG